MRRVSIRDLSGDAIRTCSDDNEALGVTSKGALVGVLVPLTHETFRELTVKDVHELEVGAAKRASEVDDTSSNLRDVLQDPPPPPGQPRSFPRVSIREISGARLEQASAKGEPLVVTSDRVAVAMFVPVVSEWLDSLVEDSVARFLGGESATTSDTTRTGGVLPERINATQLSERVRISRHEFVHGRAIGIRIVEDISGDRGRIVGVVTDGLAKATMDPITLPLEHLTEEYVVDRILELIEQLSLDLADTDELIGVGIEVGGHVTRQRVVRSANTRWNEFPLADHLSKRLGTPVALTNDANALAIAERWRINDGSFAVVLLTEHGIGCGLVLDKRLHLGSRGMAGELGHSPVGTNPFDAQPCRCGNYGCLETVATPHAIDAKLRMEGFSGGYEEAVVASENQLAYDVLNNAGAALGQGIATLLNMLDLDAVVIHGPMDLVGPPRTFHIDNLEKVADTEKVSGVSRIYTNAMVHNIRSHVFSNAATDCQFIVRIRSDKQGAESAAASAIHSRLGAQWTRKSSHQGSPALRL